MFFANFSVKNDFFENSILSGPDCLVLEWTYEKELDIYLKLYPFPTRCFNWFRVTIKRLSTTSLEKLVLKGCL